MIDEKKLLKKLNTWHESLSPRTDIRDSIKCDVIDNVITMIEDTEKVGEWIPVSEKLPEPCETVLVTLRNTAGLVTFKDTTGPIVEVGDYFPEVGWLFYGSSVTAWQPLPEPHREESAE